MRSSNLSVKKQIEKDLENQLRFQKTYGNNGHFHPFCSQVDTHHSQTVNTVEAEHQNQKCGEDHFGKV